MDRWPNNTETNKNKTNNTTKKHTKQEHQQQTKNKRHEHPNASTRRGNQQKSTQTHNNNSHYNKSTYVMCFASARAEGGRSSMRRRSSSAADLRGSFYLSGLWARQSSKSKIVKQTFRETSRHKSKMRCPKHIASHHNSVAQALTYAKKLPCATLWQVAAPVFLARLWMHLPMRRGSDGGRQTRVVLARWA